MKDLNNRMTIRRASAIFRESLKSGVTVYHTADNAYLSAPTFEEFITRNRLILHEEVSR